MVTKRFNSSLNGSSSCKQINSIVHLSKAIQLFTDSSIFTSCSLLSFVSRWNVRPTTPPHSSVFLLPPLLPSVSSPGPASRGQGDCLVSGITFCPLSSLNASSRHSPSLLTGRVGEPGGALNGEHHNQNSSALELGILWPDLPDLDAVALYNWGVDPTAHTELVGLLQVRLAFGGQILLYVHH